MTLETDNARKIIAGATQGPWMARSLNGPGGAQENVNGPNGKPLGDFLERGDAVFAAEARTGWPRALDLLARPVKPAKRGFTLSPKENKRAKAWCKQHSKQHRDGYDSWTYKFTQTGIGVKVVVACSCRAEKDVTDYESW